MDFKDKQPGTNKFYPISDAAEANAMNEAMLTCYRDSQLRGMEAWFAVVTCAGVKFVYPMDCDKGIPEDKVIKFMRARVQQQHEQWGRPKWTEPAKLIHITADVVRELEAGPRRIDKAGDNPGCDFCSTPIKQPFKVYDCEDFVKLDGITSTGGWAACQHCSRFIDADDRAGLVNHQVAVTLKMPEYATEDKQFEQRLREGFERSTSDFWKHRKFTQSAKWSVLPPPEYLQQ